MNDFYHSRDFRKTATAIGIGMFGIVTVGVTLPAQADTLVPYSGPPITAGPGAVPVVTTTSGPAYQLTSLQTGSPAYSGLYLELSTPITVDSLTQLSASYVMTEGTFGGGAPRFSLIDGSGNALDEAYIYFGTPAGGGSFSDPNAGNTTFASTGNYADLASADVRVYSNGFAGINTPNTGDTWAQFVTAVDATGAPNPDNEIADVSLDLDGGFTGNEQMDVQNYDVNGEVFNPSVVAVPEPASWTLLGAGMLLAFGFLRRKKGVTATGINVRRAT